MPSRCRPGHAVVRSNVLPSANPAVLGHPTGKLFSLTGRQELHVFGELRPELTVGQSFPGPVSSATVPSFFEQSCQGDNLDGGRLDQSDGRGGAKLGNGLGRCSSQPFNFRAKLSVLGYRHSVFRVTSQWRIRSAGIPTRRRNVAKHLIGKPATQFLCGWPLTQQRDQVDSGLCDHHRGRSAIGNDFGCRGAQRSQLPFATTTYPAPSSSSLDHSRQTCRRERLVDSRARQLLGLGPKNASSTLYGHHLLLKRRVRRNAHHFGIPRPLHEDLLSSSDWGRAGQVFKHPARPLAESIRRCSHILLSQWPLVEPGLVGYLPTSHGRRPWEDAQDRQLLNSVAKFSIAEANDGTTTWSKNWASLAQRPEDSSAACTVFTSDCSVARCMAGIGHSKKRSTQRSGRRNV